MTSQRPKSRKGYIHPDTWALLPMTQHTACCWHHPHNREAATTAEVVCCRASGYKACTPSQVSLRPVQGHTHKPMPLDVCHAAYLSAAASAQDSRQRTSSGGCTLSTWTLLGWARCLAELDPLCLLGWHVVLVHNPEHVVAWIEHAVAKAGQLRSHAAGLVARDL